jgi:hypothetical protein
MKIDASRRQVRKFGLLFGFLCSALAAYGLFKANPHWSWYAAGALLFIAAGLFAYRLLRPVYVAWMMLAQVLAWLNTRVILGVFFYAILTPAGFILRLLGKDLLDERIDRSAATYWIRRAPAAFDKSKYQHLF